MPGAHEVVADDDDALPLGLGAVRAEHAAEADERKRLAAQTQDALALAGARALRQLHALDDAVDGDDVGLRADAHAEAFDDRERERKADLDRRPGIGPALDRDRSPHRRDAFPDDVHAHAPARPLGDALRGRESGLEHQPVQLRVGQLLRVLGEAAAPRLLDDAAAIEAGSVVGELDDDRSGLAPGRERDGAAGVLALGAADLGRLDPVMQGVADHVGQRVAQVLDDGRVHLDLFALDRDARELALGGREVAHGADELAQRRTHRHHPHLHDELLELRVELCGVLVRLEGARHGVLLEKLPEAAAGDRDLARDRHEAVELVDGHAERAGRLAGSRRSVGRGRRRARGARAQPAEHLPVLRRDLVVALDRDGQHLPHGVDGFEERAHEARRHGKRPLAELLELVLQGVRELRDAGESQGGRVSLERVRHAKDRLQDLGVVGLPLEREQAFLDRPEVLLRLGDEGQQQGLGVEFHRLQSFATHALPRSVWKMSLRPERPPTSRETTGTPSSSSRLNATPEFFSPRWPSRP